MIAEDGYMITISELSEAKARIEELIGELDFVLGMNAKQQARIEELEAKNARFKEALEATTQALYTFCPSPATFTINGATKSIYDVINDAADALEKGTDDGD